MHRNGKDRLHGNQSQISYAASLRNYKIVDYNTISHDIDQQSKEFNAQNNQKRSESQTVNILKANQS